MNIPEFLEEKEPFYKFNREERNVAAILYHLLLVDGNLARFADLVKANITTVTDQVEVYYEYSYLRDLWHRTRDKDKQQQNDKRRELVRSFLTPRIPALLQDDSVFQFNEALVGGRASSTDIQSPGRWSVMKIAGLLPDDGCEASSDRCEFLRTCRFKWAFNIKPDVVIFDAERRAICVECKLDSGESSYPSEAVERREFDRRKLERVHQTELQEYLMDSLLGFTTTFVYLTRKTPTSAHDKVSRAVVKPVGEQLAPRKTALSWKGTFKALPHATCPTFIREWIDSL